MDPAEDPFAAAIAGKTELRDVNCRDVGGGFILTGQRRWVDPANGVLAVSQTFEGIAADRASASAKIGAFLDNGSFAIAGQ